MDFGLVVTDKTNETSPFSSEERRSKAVKNGYVDDDELEKKEVNWALIAREDSPESIFSSRLGSKQGSHKNKQGHYENMEILLKKK